MLATAGFGADVAAPRIPLEHFFAEPDIRSVEISPDGKHIAFLTTLGTGRVGVALMDVATGKLEPLIAAKDENIKWFIWKGSDYVVYGGDLGGNESASIRSINLTRRNVTILAESYRETISDRANQAVIVDTLLFDPNYLLIYGNKEVGSHTFMFWRLDIRSGERWSIDSGDVKWDTSQYVADASGAIRARSRFEGDRFVYEVCPTPGSLFVKVAEFPAKDPRWRFLRFAADNETLYLLSNERTDTGTLYSLNVRTRQLSEPLFNVPDGEIDNVLMSWDRRKLYGVVYSTDKTHYHFVDAAREKLQNQIEATFPNSEDTIVNTTPDERMLVVFVASDRDPGTYYLLDRSGPRLTRIGSVHQNLNPGQLAPMEAVKFASRDGLVIHGYLTRPLGSAGKRVPLIIHPHGGPYGFRDEWGFDGEVQFLANRGYAVLQINYRGSGGYGLAFETAGKREWGGKMQDDLTDGVNWAIAQGITDAEHVAIYGASYGGYATLAGLTFTPELYRCGINYVGVSNLALITSWARGRFGRGSDQYSKEWIGDGGQYKHDRSPVNFVDRIKVPLLNAYGRDDPRVVMANWTQLESKLKQYGKTYEIVIEENEGHGFRNEASRLNFYRHVEAFLAKYFPPP